jgi:hypothetical protein
MEKSVFEVLSAINVNDKTEKKSGFTYLSWALAWDQAKRIYPSLSYRVLEFDGKPFLHDSVLGYLVKTEVTIEGETLPMMLPVLDGANKSQKSEPYTYKTKYGEKSVDAATFFDINTAVMRCLVKNLALFGLGLYIYAGEDLPVSSTDSPSTEEKPKAASLPASVPKKGEVVEKTLLVEDSENWVKVLSYIASNKDSGLETIVKNLETKYKITTTIKKKLSEAHTG